MEAAGKERIRATGVLQKSGQNPAHFAGETKSGRNALKTLRRGTKMAAKRCADRAVGCGRVEPVPEARPTIWLGLLGRLCRRQISCVGEAGDSSRDYGNPKSLHWLPRPWVQSPPKAMNPSVVALNAASTATLTGSESALPKFKSEASHISLWKYRDVSRRAKTKSSRGMARFLTELGV
jgi:hypothetical protein